MNNTLKDQQHTRKSALLDWLGQLPQHHGLQLDTLEPASSDASFRQYYRLHTPSGSLIAMDSPPDLEDAHAFVRIGERLDAAGLVVPQVLEADIERGFLLLTDLGRQNYWHLIQQGVDDNQLQTWYRRAIATLVRMQSVSVSGLPVYDKKRLVDELALFEQWYVQGLKQVTLTDKEHQTLQQIWHILGEHNAQAAQVFVHRDYHSPNLMLNEHKPDHPQPGIIDYQDAVAGPITYDIASLVMDARTTWEEDQQLDWAIRYWEAARQAGLPVHPDFALFHVGYEWMSLQRNLRILGVFARLSLRDGKHHYLDHLPRVNSYIRQVARRYHQFGPLLRVLDTIDETPIQTGYTF